LKLRVRFRDLNSYLRSEFGERVQKIVVDAGFTCPNRDGKISSKGCIFCNSRGSGSGAFKAGKTITEQLETGKKRVGKRYKAKKFLAYFQSFTNTYGSLEHLQKIYDEAFSVDGVIGLSIGTRPDCMDKSKADLMKRYSEEKLIWIEYGMQSVHDRTLSLIKRGHDFKCFQEAVRLTQNSRVRICSHVILGLPGESRKDMLETARVISDMGIHGVKIHLLYVVKNTILADMYQKGTYTCMEQQEYADRVCDFLELLPKEMIIQRLTGDPYPDDLVAPQWALEKSKNLNMIKEILEKRDSYQGKYYKKK